MGKAYSRGNEDGTGGAKPSSGNTLSDGTSTGTGGGVINTTPNTGGTTTAKPSTGGGGQQQSQTNFNPAAANQAADLAQRIAYQAYLDERLRTLELPQFQSTSQQQKDELAFKMAQQKFEEVFREASVTGSYKGQPTTQWLAEMANFTGEFGGQKTLDYLTRMGALTGTIEGKATLAKQALDLDAEVRRRQTDIQQGALTGEFGGYPTLDAEIRRGQLGIEGGALSGEWNGRPTLDAEIRRRQAAAIEAQLSGEWGGRPTLEAEMQRRRAAAAEGEMQGFFDGNPTLGGRRYESDRQAQAAQLSGYFNGAPTLERQREQDQTGTQLMQLLAGLRGPKDAFQFAKVLNSGGLKGILDAVSGRYNMASFGGGDTGQLEAVTGANWLGPPGPMSGQAVPAQFQKPDAPYWEAMAAKAAAGGVPGTGAGAPPVPVFTGAPPPVPGTTHSPPGAQAPTDAYNYERTPTGNTNVYPPGEPAPAGHTQVSTVAPHGGTDSMNAMLGSAYGGGPAAPTGAAQPMSYDQFVAQSNQAQAQPSGGGWGVNNGQWAYQPPPPVADPSLQGNAFSANPNDPNSPYYDPTAAGAY